MPRFEPTIEAKLRSYKYLVKNKSKYFFLFSEASHTDIWKLTAKRGI